MGRAPLPDDAAIAAVIGAPRRASSTVSRVEPHRAPVERFEVVYEATREVFKPSLVSVAVSDVAHARCLWMRVVMA